MIAGLVEILLFQGPGETVSRFALPLIPGPVIGLVLLLAWFRLRHRVAQRKAGRQRPGPATILIPPILRFVK